MPDRAINTFRRQGRRLMSDMPVRRNERSSQRVVPHDVVAHLRSEDKIRLDITMGHHFSMGRHPDCDYVVASSKVSARHLRLSAVRTSTSHPIVCVYDTSTNGYLLNGELQKASDAPTILRIGDTIQLSGDEHVFVFSHSSQPQTQSVATVECRSSPLFDPSPDQSLEVEVGPWTVYNYPLGHGTFGLVSLASQQGRQVACKSTDIGHEPDEAIANEIRLLKRMSHRNVCGILDVVETDHHVHVFLPLVVGGDLFGYRDKHGVFTEDECRFAALQLVRGVSYLHEQGIVHRDIKLENILLRTSAAYPHLLIADFGLATTYKQVLATVPHTRTRAPPREHLMDGTVSYQPPEKLLQVLGRASGTAGLGESVHGGLDNWRRTVAQKWFDEERAWDVWAIGVVFYTLLAGIHPYDNHQDLDAEGEDDVESQLTYGRMSSSKSWDAYRGQSGEGTIGARKDRATRERERLYHASNAFTRVEPRYWQPYAYWDKVSDQAKDLVSTLLARSPDQRLCLDKAKTHEWFEAEWDHLEAMYQAVVVEGKLGRGRGVKHADVRVMQAQVSRKSASGTSKIAGANAPASKGKGKSKADKSAQSTATAKAQALLKPKINSATPKSGPDPSKSKVVKAPPPSPAPAYKTPITPIRRRTSLFVPDGGIFSQGSQRSLQKIQEEDEGEEASSSSGPGDTSGPSGPSGSSAPKTLPRTLAHATRPLFAEADEELVASGDGRGRAGVAGGTKRVRDDSSEEINDPSRTLESESSTEPSLIKSSATGADSSTKTNPKRPKTAVSLGKLARPLVSTVSSSGGASGSGSGSDSGSAGINGGPSTKPAAKPIAIKSRGPKSTLTSASASAGVGATAGGRFGKASDLSEGRGRGLEVAVAVGGRPGFVPPGQGQ